MPDISKQGDKPEQEHSDTQYSADKIYGTGWTYIRHVVDTAREPFLILADDLRILTVNESFLQVFDLNADDITWKMIYEIGDGQWDIPSFRRLLDEILPKSTFFKGYEIEHEYPRVGKKVFLMNAREVRVPHKKNEPPYPKMIILAMEDITKERELEERLELYSAGLEQRLMDKAKDLEKRIATLEKNISKPTS